MATTADFVGFVCEQIEGVGVIRTKKMFGEYMVYVDDKPVLMVCDNTVFVKTLPCLDELMAEADKGYPYDGAKEHYILDVENRSLAAAVITALLSVIPLPRPKKKKGRRSSPREIAAEDIFKVFRAAANPEKSSSMSAYMRHQFVFLGIQTPERRKLSRGFLKAVDKTAVDWDFVFKCWEQPEREFQYLATDYLVKLQAKLTAADIPNLRKIALQKSWWDTIDGLDLIVGDIALRDPAVNDTLLRWSRDENFWLRRIAIDHQLTRKEKTDTRLLEQIIVNNLGQTEFFINKAIGWALRNYSKTNPDWVRGFLERHGEKMATISVREAGKYI